MDTKIIQFLKNLAANNNREWFAQNKNLYEICKKEIELFSTEILKELKSVDDRLNSLEPKNCIYRIYRDVRFSQDKTPYKTHFGIYFAPDGKTSWKPGYYIHIEPNNIFIGGGVWMPKADILKKVRQEIYYNIDQFLKITNNDNLKKYFQKLEPLEQNVRPPKDFPTDFEYIEIIKLKSFIYSYKFSDEEFLKNSAPQHISEILKTLQPINKFFQQAFD